MPSYNQARFIEDSIQSVLSQNEPDVQLIVQDGSSSDGTVEHLTRLAEKDARLQWRSQPDNGPAAAINRALSVANGDIIGWLNSDDLYTVGALNRAQEFFERSPQSIMCYGKGIHIDGVGREIGVYPTQHPTVGLDGFKAGCFICQPTVFFRKELFETLGTLDESLKTTFDYDYWLRAFLRFPEQVGFVDAIQAKSRLHESCITKTMRETVALEGLALGRRYLGNAQPHWASSYLEELFETMDGDHEKFAKQALEFCDRVEQFLSNEHLNQTRWSIRAMTEKTL